MHRATRPPTERFAALDRALRAGRYPNARSLADEIEVSPRTVQRDVEFLRDRMGAPIAFDPRRNGYYYADPTYLLGAATLSQAELLALLLAERALRQYRGTPYAADLARAFAKVAAGLEGPEPPAPGDLDAAYSFRTAAAAPPDPAVFGALGAAVRGRRRVAIAYWTASRDEETRREVDPYHLACVDARWYLIGYCHARHEVLMFAAWRIRSLEQTCEGFDEPPDFDADSYLAGAFAAMRGGEGERHRVRLRFTGEATRYAREPSWHPSQTAEEGADGSLLIGLEVSHLREVERWALSWGAECEVLEPAELRDRVARAAATTAAIYGGDGGGADLPEANRCR
ncbi:MAG TPA: transcriptional regulator [Isosphaeraceae bacterium]|jgi:predicted DNA-binding transcriptional regulator YafY|nr:transcriptional regulator [Isosphaeraceae bacterium]